MKVKTSPHACMQEYISRDVQDYAMHRGFCIFMEHYTYPEGTFVIEMQGKTEIAVYNWMQALTFLERYLSVYLMTSEQRVYWEEVQRLIREHKR